MGSFAVNPDQDGNLYTAHKLSVAFSKADIPISRSKTQTVIKPDGSSAPPPSTASRQDGGRRSNDRTTAIVLLALVICLGCGALAYIFVVRRSKSAFGMIGDLRPAYIEAPNRNHHGSDSDCPGNMNEAASDGVEHGGSSGTVDNPLAPSQDLVMTDSHYSGTQQQQQQKQQHVGAAQAPPTSSRGLGLGTIPEALD